jgi:protoporphyrinogen oxidase
MTYTPKHTPAQAETNPTAEPRIVILGAGPTGLGAAYRLNEMGYRNWAIYERHDYIGGLATSFTDDAGFTYDIGGHVMFSHYPYFDALVDKLLAGDYTEIQREAWVWMENRFVPYPFQNNIRYLSQQSVYECLSGLIEAHRHPERVRHATNFDELIDAQFGAGIARHFMKPYNFKVWATPVSQMSRDWLGERVAMPDLNRVLQNVVMQRDDVNWGPNNKFKYPLYGGTGGLYERFMPYIQDHLTLNTTVASVDQENKVIHFTDGSTTGYDLLFSTMPLDLLVGKMQDPPEAARAAARKLQHSSGLIVGVGIARRIDTSKCWLYFPEENAPFYRVTYLSQYSPYITPEGDYTLFLTETSYSAYKPEDKATIVERVIAGLKNTQLMNDDDVIVTTYLIDVDYSYPVPTIERNSGLAVLHPYLAEYDIFSRGRFGAWQYEIGNMDHSVMQGVEWVNRMLLDEAETTWKPIIDPMTAPVPANVPVGAMASLNGATAAAAVASSSTAASK